MGEPLYPFLAERAAFHPDTGEPHPDLPPVSAEFMELWRGTLQMSSRQHLPYVVVAANPMDDVIVDIHPNDLLDFIFQLVRQQPPLHLVGLWGAFPFRSRKDGEPVPPTFRQIFVGFASADEAQQFTTRFEAWDFDWTKFPIYRRTGLQYWPAPDGADPFIKETPKLVKALTARLGDPRLPVKLEPGSSPGRSGSAAGFSDSRPAQRPRLDPDPAATQLRQLLAAHPHLLDKIPRR